MQGRKQDIEHVKRGARGKLADRTLTVRIWYFLVFVERYMSGGSNNLLSLCVVWSMTLKETPPQSAPSICGYSVPLPPAPQQPAPKSALMTEVRRIEPPSSFPSTSQPPPLWFWSSTSVVTLTLWIEQQSSISRRVDRFQGALCDSITIATSIFWNM